jgi:trans-aconitate methyltransferase
VTGPAGSAHWDETYLERADDVSWFETTPATSIDMIRGLPLDSGAGIVDVGGGASTLVDHLLADGREDLTVLDLSQVALDRARARVGPSAPVEWVCGDVTEWRPSRTYSLWHDRAVFHFLTEPAAQARYLEVLRAAVPDGWVVLATFAPDGPDSCSGLPVARHSVDDLTSALAGFEVVDARRHVHTTPWGTEQPFSYVAAHRS